MGSLRRSLSDDVLAVFERACQENEFELANHLLSALEAIASKQTDRHQLDATYLTFIASCDLDTRPSEPKQVGGNQGHFL